MSDPIHPDENPDREDPQVPAVHGSDEDVDSVGLPDHDFLGLSPGDANDETEPSDPPVPDQA
jgi:hypothetical protein